MSNPSSFWIGANQLVIDDPTAVAPLQLYVNGATGNDDNDGKSLSAAKKTIMAAIQVAMGYDFSGGTDVTINARQVTVAENLYFYGSADSSFVSTNANSCLITLAGDPLDRASVQIPYIEILGTKIGLKNLTCPSIYAFGGAYIWIEDCTLTNVDAYDSGTNVFVLPPCTFTGSTGRALGALLMAEIQVNAGTFTISNSPTYANGMLFASQNGVIFINTGTIFSGAFTGPKCRAQANSQIITNSATISSGSVSTGANGGRIDSLTYDNALTVSQLPAAAAALEGARAFVTDANAATFGTTVAAGGSNNVPVFCDGTVWKIG